MSGDVQLDGAEQSPRLHHAAPADAPVPMPVMLGGWWGDKFNRLFQNTVTTPNLKQVDA